MLVAVAFQTIWSSFHSGSVLFERHPDRQTWIRASLLGIAGIGALGASRYLLRLYPERIDEASEAPASGLISFLIIHRNVLTKIALAGLAVSVLEAIQIAIGSDWALRPLSSLLAAAAFGLLITAFAVGRLPKQESFGILDKAPRWVGQILLAVNIVLLGMGLLLGWSYGFRHPLPDALEASSPPMLFLWETLFFGYGRMKQPSGVEIQRDRPHCA
jgi:hypothetical protein